MPQDEEGQCTALHHALSHVVLRTPKQDARIVGAHRIGDGDCGTTLKRGAEAIKAAVGSSLPLNDAGAALRELATTLRVMGGTSGALYNIGLTAAAGAALVDRCS